MFYALSIIFDMLVSSADNLCKQFWLRIRPDKHQAWSGSKLSKTLIVFLKEFFEMINFEKKYQQMTKKHAKYLWSKELRKQKTDRRRDEKLRGTTYNLSHFLAGIS